MLRAFFKRRRLHWKPSKNVQRVIFKDYVDDVKEFLLDRTFDDNTEKSLLQIQTQTLTALQNLDPRRKHDVIMFLYEKRLLDQNRSAYLVLTGAILNGVKFIRSATQDCHLPHLYLPGVSAENIVFDGCWLQGAVLD